ncbi:MAG: hypothetical protein PHV90_09150 [Smithella sp.]|jgi:hypothetical protein|nr:hypothetical protein [Smithella sp.]
MTRLTFSPPSKSEYTFGKDLNLLPFELFNYVKEGRLHPLDKDTGRPIPRPDALRIKKRLEKVEQEIKVLPLAYGALQTGQVMTRNFNHSDKEQKIQALDKRAKELPKERAKIKKELQSITNDWATYNTPDDPRPDFDILQNALFRKSEVDQLSTTDGGKSPAKENAPNPQNEPATKEQVENYLQRSGKYWAIKFQDEYNAHIDHVDGLLYIAHILRSKPGENISDRHLISLAKIKLQADSNEKMAISNNLSDQMEYQESHDQKAHCEYLARYNQLKIDLESAESDLERNEIKKEMTAMLLFLKQRNIAGQEEKRAQANITKRLKVAYRALENEGMEKLANHLRQCITTANYSRVYTGGFVWKIFL